MSVQPQQRRSHHVLIVEDDDAHALIIQSCLRSINLPGLSVTSVRARDGMEAVECLEGEGAFANLPMPSLILLDLKLPRVDGRELLAQIKANPEWWLIPVVVLTTSNARTDRLRAYDLQASGYVVKPLGIAGFRSMIHSSLRYWPRWNCQPASEDGQTAVT
ncbi:MAG: response regulator [Planctomycetota bacterium]